MKKANPRNKYYIMHGDQKTASIDTSGSCEIYAARMMPYNLYLEQADVDDIDTRIQNLDNFYHWCSSRMLTLDRTYAKEILNSIGATQSSTDKDRAQVALSYHCLSLMDIFWTKEDSEQQSFSDINLFENHLESAFIDVSLRGRQITIQNRHLIADDLGTSGCYPKAWLRRGNTFYLLKDGDADAVEKELLASKICRCFHVNQVLYEEERYDGQKVSVSEIITSPKQSIVPMEYFEIYCTNHDKDKMNEILTLDGYSYYMMNILDYLIGNTDRHWGNWGVLVDNSTNLPIRLYDLMDFNKAFEAYDTLDGANCLTSPERINQREAAADAVQKIGLNQIAEISPEWFPDAAIKDMFFQRLQLLQKTANP